MILTERFEQQVVVTHEQIMALPNLNGYWKYGDAVVPFRIEPMKLKKRTDAFIPRQTQAKVTTTPSQELAVAPPSLASRNGHHQKHEAEIEIDISADPDELDIKF